MTDLENMQRDYDVYDGRCGASSTKIYTNYTTLTQNGTFCSGPPSERIHRRYATAPALPQLCLHM